MSYIKTYKIKILSKNLLLKILIELNQKKNKIYLKAKVFQITLYHQLNMILINCLWDATIKSLNQKAIKMN